MLLEYKVLTVKLPYNTIATKYIEGDLESVRSKGTGVGPKVL